MVLETIVTAATLTVGALRDTKMAAEMHGILVETMIIAIHEVVVEVVDVAMMIAGVEADMTMTEEVAGVGDTADETIIVETGIVVEDMTHHILQNGAHQHQMVLYPYHNGSGSNLVGM